MKITLLLFLLVGASCTGKDPRELTKIQIIDLTKQYNKTWETLDVEKIAAYHSNESFLYWSRGELSCKSNVQFQKVFSNILPMMKKWTIKETTSFSVQVLNKDAAVVSFLLNAESVGLDGIVSNHGSGALTYIWNKINGEWKLIQIHESAK
ncbi:MAG TPA: nuclear transport factor 2 family protein [Phnomibacter sp.]|nr:nuclear transport factor 2 family protein [Phnomibacter sp.]